MKDLKEFVTKKKGTEKPFENAYWDEKRPGLYVDVNSGDVLFSSQDKFDSGTGWPSFTKPLENAPIMETADRSWLMKRTEVHTDQSHLGHVFNDGPQGNLRYCINSAALRFIPYEDLEKEGYGSYKESFAFEQAAFAAGCFWGVEHLFKQAKGVVSTTAGYMGGHVDEPSYHEVSSSRTGHAETVLVIYDPQQISYEDLLSLFWRMHDPTTKNRQGPNIGSQYRSIIFYYTDQQRQAAQDSQRAFERKGVFPRPVVTEILPASAFFPAEESHQDYYERKGGHVCHTLRQE